MRTFILRARKAPTDWKKILTSIGTDDHVEIIAHVIMNAFFTASDFREHVEVYIILESSPDFPKAIYFSGEQGLSFPGFDEHSILKTVESALKASIHLEKNDCIQVMPGIQVFGFGFEKCIQQFYKKRPIFILDKKGSDIRGLTMPENPVFILSDHLAMPKNNIKTLKNQGATMMSLGKKMLFASQCVTLIQYECDR